MRLLLVQSYTDVDEPPIFPLGLAVLAAVLTPAHEVRVLDLNVRAGGETDLGREIAAFEPEAMGISLRNIKIARPGQHLSCFDTHRAAIRAMRTAAPHIPLLVGGCAFSLFGELTMREVPEIDLGVWGEAEETLPALLASLDDPGAVPGVYHRSASAVHFSGRPVFPDFAALPVPRRDIVPLAPYLADPQSLGVQGKRGCVLHCLHCSDTFLTGNRLRLREPAAIAAEVQDLAENHGAPHVFFSDQVFNLPVEHTRELCRELIARRVKVKWTAWFNERGVGDETIALCREAGCYQLSFSPDTADARVMRALRKNIRPADLERTLAVAQRQQMPVTFNFMINGPGETLGSLMRLGWFLLRAKLKLRGLLRLHGLFVTTMRIYPHTDLEELALARGMIQSREDLATPTFYNPPPLRLPVKAGLWVLQGLWRVRQALRRRG
jgi:anaerobic magnesium-protoporphyrin IX monomethyl ester cyclase